MQAGKLRHRVDIQSLDTSDVDGRGHPTNEWVDLYTCIPAEIITLGGREAELARQLVANADTRITIRYMDNINTKNKIIFGDRTFGIGAVNNVDQRNNTLIFTCKEQT